MEEVKRQVVAQAAIDILAKFTREAAEACLAGFIVTMFVIMGAGAEQWNDQIVRFRPDGRVRFLVGVWEMREGKQPRYNQWSVLAPATMRIPPPFPAWPFPGLLQGMRNAQDFTQMRELPAHLRCDAEALAELPGCNSDVWRKLLQALCLRCQHQHRNGLPCVHDKPLVDVLDVLFEAHRDRNAKTECPHGLMAAVLALNSRSSIVPAEVEEKTWKVRGYQGAPVEVLHICVRQILQDLRNRLEVNVPIMELAPFPFHTGALRSARLNVRAETEYYQSFLRVVSQHLSRHGVQHVFVPGDSASGSTLHDAHYPEGGPLSLFIPYDLKSDVAEVMPSLVEELEREFNGLWRFLRRSAALWQVGEEPYRFSPSAGVSFRVFCKECVHVSMYFYEKVIEGSQRSLLPLAHFEPCMIPLVRVFPVRYVSSVARGAEEKTLSRAPRSDRLPLAADAAWIRRAARTPPRLVPEDAVTPWRQAAGGGASCRAALRATVAQRLAREGDADAGPIERLRPPPDLTHEFDLSPGVYDGLGLFDLMRQREDSEREGLRRCSSRPGFFARASLCPRSCSCLRACLTTCRGFSTSSGPAASSRSPRTSRPRRTFT
eukprot:TRINITY_DN22208_c0_g1_i1.p1 TRINITY_DN22208_c0_g1~~TRINITY_DN22208_c0_g1_i1.p1  ORF type:complete len:649 (-),score=104.71 TRINITY_DN22208_c0_g1_i1:824-2629(-)